MYYFILLVRKDSLKCFIVLFLGVSIIPKVSAFVFNYETFLQNSEEVKGMENFGFPF